MVVTMGSRVMSSRMAIAQPVRPPIESSLDAIPTSVKAILDAVAPAIEPVGPGVVAVGPGSIRAPVKAVIDAFASVIEAVIDAIAAVLPVVARGVAGMIDVGFVRNILVVRRRGSSADQARGGEDQGDQPDSMGHGFSFHGWEQPRAVGVQWVQPRGSREVAEKVAPGPESGDRGQSR